MQPLKMTIAGKFWDSYIYKGKLYLWNMDGSIRIINWDRLIASWNVDVRLRLPLEAAFSRSDFLYRPDLQRMFSDPDVRDLMREKFVALSRNELDISPQRLAAHEANQQDNPFAFPHSDCEIYDRTIYVSAPSGVTSATTGRGTKFPISTKTEKRWDAPVLRLSASWGSLALAVGSEGLYEADLSGYYPNWSWSEERRNPIKRATEHCADCNWTFHSIFGSSERGGFLASFRKSSAQTTLFEPMHTQQRVFDRVITEQELWGRQGYAWGVQDKLCLATEGRINVLKYQPWNRDGEHIVSLGFAEIRPWKGSVISASSAPFGVVVELENALVVYPSKGASVTIGGEPVNWRVFPRARHYKNQLHIVKEDCLEIYSFNQDYLVDQSTKKVGVSLFMREDRRYAAAE